MERGFGENQINAFSKPLLLDMIFILFSAYTLRNKQRSEKDILLIIFYSLMIFIGLSDFPVLAFRIREMFSVLLIIIVAVMLNGNKIQHWEASALH